MGGVIEVQLRYLYERKSLVDQLIRSLEAYSGGACAIPRKRVGGEVAATAVRSLAS